jgi:hypothetical protein
MVGVIGSDGSKEYKLCTCVGGTNTAIILNFVKILIKMENEEIPLLSDSMNKPCRSFEVSL